MLRKAIITTAILLLFCICPAEAQKRSQKPVKADSVITLLNAEWAKLMKVGYYNYRLIKGPAAFYHNGAYLFCDSAAWNIDREIIKAYGKVRITQDNTVLRSDSLTYLIQQDLAQFRGSLVEVFDNDGDTLRTNNLDYNTKDSLAIFRSGGAMKDKEGNVIEGNTGIYTASRKTFTFDGNVQMFTDSIFLITEKLDYMSSDKKAYFRDRTYVWRDNGFMTALAGWYDTDNEVINFNDDVYINDPDYEMWADEVFYYRQIPRYEAYHNVVVLDTLNETAFVAHKAIVVTDTLNNQHMEFTEGPAVFYYGENEDHVKDSLFIAADTLRIYTVRSCDITDKEERLKERQDILFDAIAEAEAKAAEEREKARAEAEAKKPENIARQKREMLAAQATVDSLAALGIAAPDSIYIAAGLDPQREKENLLGTNSEVQENVPDVDEQKAPQEKKSPAGLSPRSGGGMAGGAIQPDAAVTEEKPAADNPGQDDTAEKEDGGDEDSEEGDKVDAPPDTTKIKYLNGWPNVRIYRSDMQLLCDSLAYSDVDSLARLHGNPVMWYKTRNQLTSDVMILLMKNETLDRGSMQENAMLVMQEDEDHFDQIKSTEMIGHFRDNDLYRYDALGGVNAMFYLKEKEEITTINIKESRFMTMSLKDGTAQRIKYYEQTQSDAYPVYNLEIDKQRIKGFQWRGEERPLSRYDVTNRDIRQSERVLYEDVQMPVFRIADRYFNRYMSKVYSEIIAREDARAKARAERDSIAAAAQDSALMVQQDSLFTLPDNIVEEPEAPGADVVAPAEEAGVQHDDGENKPSIIGRRRTDEKPVEEPVADEPAAFEPEPVRPVSDIQPAAAVQLTPTRQEQRILRKADKMIQKSNKKFFKNLYKEVMRTKMPIVD